ncbi:aldehyde dehydrogenase family protein [Saccharothrix sp. S26]|uniref:aldehyde dehydrogenase family protein n=1 Tax=Saccharothrix sp. S26 TaxID=2907215 RepID=UPI001F15984B|nr:aldehyde dehydrogenase family protein [Saccharothrix sp. S26]MCE6993499.1 aldehyde dehydrogenase family protein [Saccharothrix sp. S26]
MARYAAPGAQGSVVSYRDRYDHFIGGEYVPPARGGYFADRTPVTGEVFTEVARGTAEDVDRALDAAHGAARRWGRTTPAERATVLTEIADRVEDHLEALAVAETWENGKPIREALAADLPRAVDHFRYFASVIRAQEGRISQLGEDLVAHHVPEPLGVVGQVIPWNHPLLMATWKLAPALAAGNAVVLKPAEQTPASIHVLMGLIADLLPPGVVNVVNGFGAEAGMLLAASHRAARVPAAPKPGGKSAVLFFADVAQRRDAFYDKALEGFTAFTFGQGEGSTCALLQSPVHDEFLADAVQRTKEVRQGHPLDPETVIGARISREQVDQVLAHLEMGRREGARVVCGGERADLGGELSGGYYVTPTILECDHEMRVFREEVFGPVVSVTRFDDFANAVKTVNDTPCGVGAGVWSRDGGLAYRAGREIQASRVWVNNHHAHPRSGIGREDHRVALDRYQRTKDLLVGF